MRKREPEDGEAVSHPDGEVNSKRSGGNSPAVIAGWGDGGFLGEGEHGGRWAIYNRISNGNLKIITELLRDQFLGSVKEKGILSKTAFTDTRVSSRS